MLSQYCRDALKWTKSAGGPAPGKMGPQAFERLPDELVVELGKQGDIAAIEYILKKFKSVVLFKSRSYFLYGSDRDDMIQEGMIGLFKAIRDFRPDRACSFRTFADVCITRQMITAVKYGAGQRHLPLLYENAFALDEHRDDLCPEPLETAVDSEWVDPEQLLIARESADELREVLRDTLSDFEWRVFVGFCEGKSYQEIARENGSSPKSVDNALCRVRRKVQRFGMRAELAF